MKKSGENLLLNSMGFLFLFLGIIAIINSIYIKEPLHVFWMCYISLVLIGAGILLRNVYLVLSQIYILAIPILLWDIDFIHWLIFQQPLWGITDYFFLNMNFTLGKIISLQHLFTLPLAIFAVKKIGAKKTDAWKLSFLQILIVFALTIIFTPEESNINCIFNPCMNIPLNLPYEIAWFALFFGAILITKFSIDKFFFRKK